MFCFLLNLITELSNVASSMGRQVHVIYREQTPSSKTPSGGDALTSSQDLICDDSDLTEMHVE